MLSSTRRYVLELLHLALPTPILTRADRAMRHKTSTTRADAHAPRADGSTPRLRCQRSCVFLSHCTGIRGTSAVLRAARSPGLAPTAVLPRSIPPLYERALLQGSSLACEGRGPRGPARAPECISKSHARPCGRLSRPSCTGAVATRDIRNAHVLPPSPCERWGRRAPAHRPLSLRGASQGE